MKNYRHRHYIDSLRTMADMLEGKDTDHFTSCYAEYKEFEKLENTLSDLHKHIYEMRFKIKHA